MTQSDEIQYLKDQIRINQVRYARCIEEKDSIAINYLEQRSRDLIDQLNRMQRKRHWDANPREGLLKGR